MSSSAVEITTPDGVAGAYLARPDDRPHPGVLLIMDAFGAAARDRSDSGARRRQRLRRACSERLLPRRPLAGAGPERQRSARELLPVDPAADGRARAGAGRLRRRGLSRLPRGSGPTRAGRDHRLRMGGRIAWRIAVAHPDRVAALA